MFLWMHLMEPHSPYAPSVKLRAKFPPRTSPRPAPREVIPNWLDPGGPLDANHYRRSTTRRSRTLTARLASSSGHCGRRAGGNELGARRHFRSRRGVLRTRRIRAQHHPLRRDAAGAVVDQSPQVSTRACGKIDPVGRSCAYARVRRRRRHSTRSGRGRHRSGRAARRRLRTDCVRRAARFALCDPHA